MATSWSITTTWRNVMTWVGHKMFIICSLLHQFLGANNAKASLVLRWISGRNQCKAFGRNLRRVLETWVTQYLMKCLYRNDTHYIVKYNVHLNICKHYRYKSNLILVPLNGFNIHSTVKYFPSSKTYFFPPPPPPIKVRLFQSDLPKTYML